MTGGIEESENHWSARQMLYHFFWQRQVDSDESQADLLPKAQAQWKMQLLPDCLHSSLPRLTNTELRSKSFP